MNSDRECETCDDYYYPDALGNTCVQDTCIILTQILLPNGKCEDCPSHTYPDGAGLTCTFDECDYEYQILSSIGTCQDCQAYSYPEETDSSDPHPKVCTELDCNPALDIMIKTDEDSYACEACADYSYPDIAGETCLTDTCDNRSQILGLNGKCSNCGDYTYPNGQNLLCISDSCDFAS